MPKWQLILNKMSKPVRKNGLDRPFDPLQVSGWILMSSNLVIVGIILIPTFEQSLQIVLSLLFYSTQLITMVLAATLTAGNPTDPISISDKAAIKKGNFFDKSISKTVCTICCCSVSPNSKHCGSCNRCVDGFDHHCKWLNNCIGNQNYKKFILLLVCIDINMPILVGFGIKSLCTYFNDTEIYKERLSDLFGCSNEALFLFFTFTTISEALLVITYDSYLIGYHAWLKWKGITTYQHILIKKAKHDKKIHSDAALRNSIKMSCLIPSTIGDKELSVFSENGETQHNRPLELPITGSIIYTFIKEPDREDAENHAV
ncbi:unnamed protein product [Blepharisma stoltei]|uniref:Palmitoyltransferase n=1 Tax=Blepharisma stoltei TaxID=1481888 RepID=A0AAU9IQ90_9CILI|nr:unnamed protein product [Blepharisma stoltei]